MSKLPNAPKMPRPSNKVTSGQFSNKNHEELLCLAWKNIDPIVTALLASHVADVLQASQLAMQDHAQTVEKVISTLEDFVGSEESFLQDKETIRQYLPACREYAEREVPVLSENQSELRVEVLETTLEAAITEKKGRYGEERIEQIGFVDLMCKVSMPVAPMLWSGIPLNLESFRPNGNSDITISWGADVGSTSKPILVEAGQQFKEPSWYFSQATENVWIDVRPELPPIGQLLRELKTLENYLGRNGKIVVVTQTVDKDIEAMAEHEGFTIIDRLWIDNVLSADENR